jgi:hypothetical protein
MIAEKDMKINDPAGRAMPALTLRAIGPAMAPMPVATTPLAARVSWGVAAILSLPAVALSAWAAAYIGHSIVTDPGYRNMFLAYGIERALVDSVFVAGIGAAAWLTIRRGTPAPRGRALGWIAATAGAVAGAWTEAEFWGDSDALLPHGAFVIPFLAWAAAFAATRVRGNTPRPARR